VAAAGPKRPDVSLVKRMALWLLVFALAVAAILVYGGKL